MIYVRLVANGRHILLKILSTYVTHLIKIDLLFLYNCIYCLHCSQPVDVMSGGSDSSSSSVTAIVVPLVVLLLLTGIVVILVAVLAYQLIKYKRQSIE